MTDLKTSSAPAHQSSNADGTEATAKRSLREPDLVDPAQPTEPETQVTPYDELWFRRRPLE